MDFTPCVPAISDRGTVAFRFVSKDGAAAIAIVEGPKTSFVQVGNVESHPAINLRGDLAFFTDVDGAKKVWVGQVDGAGQCFGETAGELGPTMNVWGDVAYRAMREGDECAVLLPGRLKLRMPMLICHRIGDYGDGLHKYERWRDHWVIPRQLEQVPEPGSKLQGLPVVDVSGRVFYCTEHAKGGKAIRCAKDYEAVDVVRTGGEFGNLGSFPACNPFGDLVFAGQLDSGLPGIFRIRRPLSDDRPYGPYWDSSYDYGQRESRITDGAVETVIDASADFESFRGALIDDNENVVFYATPTGGSLGIYNSKGRVLGLGDPFQGSVVIDFALNPVSMNRLGDFVFRLTLEDARQMIVKSKSSA